MRARTILGCSLLAAACAWSLPSRAQDPASPAPRAPADPPPVTPATPGDASPSSQPPPPPRYIYVERLMPPSMTPKYALWTGGRLGLLGFGDDFYENENGSPETTGNFLKTGLSIEADIGVRLARRYIPYIGVELGLHPPGHRFDGEEAHAYSTFVGIGFRSVWVDFADNAGFLTDLSFGLRTVAVSSGSQTFKMSSLELFRLGLGVEVRLSPSFTLSPMLTLSGGAMTDTSGSITYGPNQGDGLTHPTNQNGDQINAQRGYLVVGLSCGAHFDLFGSTQ